jgi:protein SCO1
MLRAALAIALIGAAGAAGIVAAGRRANLLPQDLDGSPAPRIRLRDARGQPIDTAALDRPYLVTFVYTHCKDVCPLIGSEIADALHRLGPRTPDVAALAVSVDPRRDTRRAARRWLADRRLPPEAHYLLGSEPVLRPIWRDWYVQGDDPRTHDASVWLVDAHGRLRGRWSGGEPIPSEDIAHDLGALLDERTAAE